MVVCIHVYIHMRKEGPNCLQLCMFALCKVMFQSIVPGKRHVPPFVKWEGEETEGGVGREGEGCAGGLRQTSQVLLLPQSRGWPAISQAYAVRQKQARARKSIRLHEKRQGAR